MRLTAAVARLYLAVRGRQVLRLDRPARPASRLTAKPGAKVSLVAAAALPRTTIAGAAGVATAVLGRRASEAAQATSPASPPPSYDDFEAEQPPTAAAAPRQPRSTGPPPPSIPAAPTTAPAAATAAGVPGGPRAGHRVEVAGVVARAELNGQRGKVTGFDAAAGRYVVALDAGGPPVKLKVTNLKPPGKGPAPPPPPALTAPPQPPKPPAPAPQADLFSFEGEASPGDGASKAAVAKARMAAMRREQAAKGTLEWDEVEERYREKAGCEASLNTSGGATVGLTLKGPGDPGFVPPANPAAAAGQAARFAAMQASQRAAVAALEGRKQAEAAVADAEMGLRARLDPALAAWSEEYGKKRNIRALLAGMHTVLWSGAKWKAVSLGDLLEDKAVLKCYRRAVLVVHSDRTVNLGLEEKFIAKRVFDALTQAFNEFNGSCS